MQSIEILTTTMYAKDLSLYGKMHLQTDAIIANQTGSVSYRMETIDNHKVRMISTQTRGSGLNRNIAISNANADIILFADDDQIFIDGYGQIVRQAFEDHPDADAIKFYCESLNKLRPLSFKRPDRFRKATKRKLMSGGVPALAVKLSFLINRHIMFPLNMGAGCNIYCGEDSLFLSDLCKAKARIYMSPILLSYVSQEDSTWFNGYSEQYFVSVGYTYAQIYKRLSMAAVLRRAFRLKDDNSNPYSFRKMVSLMKLGVQQYSNKIDVQRGFYIE